MGTEEDLHCATPNEVGVPAKYSDEAVNAAYGRAGAPNAHADVVEAYRLPGKLGAGRVEKPNSALEVSSSIGLVVEAVASAVLGRELSKWRC